MIHKSTEIISQQLIKVQTQQPEEIFKYTLNTLEEPTQLTIQPPIQTKEKKYSFFEFNKLLLLQTYADNLRLVFNEINEGELFHINDNECFFKLRLQQNHRGFNMVSMVMMVVVMLTLDGNCIKIKTIMLFFILRSDFLTFIF